MRRLCAALALPALCVGLAACGSGDDGGGEEGEVPASAEPVARAFSSVGVVALGFSAPLGAAARMLGPDSGEDQVRRDVETAVGGQSGPLPAGDGVLGGDEPIVEGAGCVTWTWGAGLSATIEFDGCTFQSGDMVDGSLTLAITLSPVSISLGFGELAINQTVLDGTLAVGVAGADLDRTTTVTADFTYAAAGGETTLELDQVTIASRPAETSVDGSGVLTTGGVEAMFTATDVAWQDGECHPSGGTLFYDDGTVAATIGFLRNTPVDGIVRVTVGNFSTETMLLEPCPSI